MKFLQDILDHLEPSFRHLFIKIENLKTDQKSRQLLEVWNTENFAQLVAYHRQKQLNESVLRRAWALKPRLPSGDIRRIGVKITMRIDTRLERLFNIGKQTGNRLLQAFTIYLRTRYIIGQGIDVISQISLLADICYHDENLFVNHIRLTLSAADIFSEYSSFQHAYHRTETPLSRSEYLQLHRRSQCRPAGESKKIWNWSLRSFLTNFRSRCSLNSETPNKKNSTRGRC